MKPLRIAHRCNTLESLGKSFVDIVEVDVHHKKNGELVLSHNSKDEGLLLTNVLFRFPLKIDIKSKDIVEDVIKEIEGDRLVIIACRIPEVLLKVKKARPDLTLELGSGEGVDFKLAMELKVDIVAPHYTHITKEFIEEAHKNNLKIHVHTVNNKEDIKRMEEWGVDGITSDY